ncbi:glucosamine-6-phosphate deaminase [Clostridia bacterium]|nr:glucosamine-6-phosphate deaminase [Clostridia bacterium]
MKIVRVEDYDKMSRTAANIISAQVILKPTSVLGLATGSTPIGVYQQLIKWYEKGDLDFSQVTTINLDEYKGLSPEDAHSYKYYMRDAFHKHINIKPENIHLPNGLAEDPDAECRRYDDVIQNSGGVDTQLLGIGHNGHIGFNEPGSVFHRDTYVTDLTSRTLEANNRFFSKEDVQPVSAYTMGIKAIMQAKRIVVIVSGKSKAAILNTALNGPIDPQVPASILQIHNDVTLIADQDALSYL